MNKLTESTLIPLGVAVAVIGGASAWMTRMHFITDATAKGLSDTNTFISSINDHLDSIQPRLARIEVLLEKEKRNVSKTGKE